MDSNDRAISAASGSTPPALFEAEPAVERRCGRCGITRPIGMFYTTIERRTLERTGMRIKRPCRVCQREKSLRWRAPRQKMLDDIKAAAGCADCGLRNPAHPEIYDFDHLPGAGKVKNIAKFLTSGTIEQMLAEVAKCEIVCSNCHRIRTRRRGHNAFGNDQTAARTYADRTLL